MTNVYKIKLCRWELNSEEYKDYCKDKDEYRKFCIDNDLISVGWQPKDGYNCKNYKTVNDYINAVNDNQKGDRDWSCVRHCFEEMKPGDFCWTQIDGNTFYLGKVSDEVSCYGYDEWGKKLEEKNLNPQAFGLWRHCEWNKNICFDDVPGNIVARFQGTMCHASSGSETGFFQYCNYLYNDKNEKLLENGKTLDFWKLTHYDDLEDLVGLFLQKECGYFVFPSTNKQGTKDYEYKLIQKKSNEENRKEAIIQCKHTDDIEFDKFKDYKENIFLLTVNGNIDWGKNGVPEDKKEWIWTNQETKEEKIVGWEYCQGRIKEFSPDKLKEWAIENEFIMPRRIQNFIKLSKEK